MSQQSSSHKWSPTMHDLVWEMKNDLKDLFEKNPEGLSISMLSGWYGESTQRILKACQQLESDGRVRLKRAANKAIFILPDDLQQGEALTVLSVKQRELVKFVAKRLEEEKAIHLKTNYTQLSRLLLSSYGGMRIRLQRCVELGFLVIVHPSMPAMSDQLVLSLGPKYKDLKEPS